MRVSIHQVDVEDFWAFKGEYKRAESGSEWKSLDITEHTFRGDKIVHEITLFPNVRWDETAGEHRTDANRNYSGVRA